MSNSPLVSYILISPHKNTGRNHAIDTISIHCMAGNLTVEGCGQVFIERDASSNYGVGSDGRIGMYVEEKDRSWCTSSGANDNRAITIEVANDGGESTGWHVSDKAMDSLIKLCADICRRNGIKKLKWKADPNLIGDVSQQNMTVHRWFANKSCPGDYLFNKHGYIATEVNKMLNAPYDPKDIQVPGDPISPLNPSNANYNYVDPKSLVDATKITPYIATISPDIKDIDCRKLESAGVVGVMLYGGSYYTIMHTVRERYRSDNIKTQAGCAHEAEMPYALYVDVRARSVAEAKLECNQLWYVLSKYPPELGVWLRLQTASSKGVNNQILEEYYKYFTKWGMKDKCGLYVTRDDLSKITWDNFYDRYLLWLIDPVKSMAGVDETLLTPEFFTLAEVN